MVLITSPSKILIDLHITVKTKKFLILPRLGYPVTSFDQKIICALAGSRDIFVNVILLTTSEVHTYMRHTQTGTPAQMIKGILKSF